jgi:hypothetical protein
VLRSGLGFKQSSLDLVMRVSRGSISPISICPRFSAMLLSPHAVSAVGKADDPDSLAQESPLWERDTVPNNSTHDGFPVLGLLPGLRRHEAAPGGAQTF